MTLVGQRTGVDGLARRLARLARESITEPCRPPADLATAMLAEVRTVVSADGGALLCCDPQTGLFTTGAVADLPAETCEPFFTVEVSSTSAHTFRRLAVTGAGARAVRSANIAHDPLAREVLEPHGFHDEARVVCRAGGVAWGALSLWRRGAPEFGSEDLRWLDGAAPYVGRALRDAVVASMLAPDGPATRLVLLLDGDRVIDMGPECGNLLPEATDPATVAYRHLDQLRSLAKTQPLFTSVLNAGGAWYVAHGMPMGGDRRAVVLTPAGPSEMFGALVAGAGLTPREVEVTRLVCRGLSDQEIARTLEVSVHTSRHHVRAVREKLGARSRGEVVARVFSERYFDDFLASASITHSD